MGRAYEVRKSSIQKTGAAKAKLYSMYSREIYDIAKKGGVDPSSNAALKRTMEKAKKEQVPGDIIKRAIDKVNSGVDESFERVRYEIFGPAGSTVIVECLIDNVNKSISDIKTVLNRCKCKLGVQGSVSFNYDHLCIIGVEGLTEEETLDTLIEAEIEIDDIELKDNLVVIYGEPKNLHQIKDAINTKIPNVEFEIDEITMLPKEKVTLSNEDKELFNKLITMLDEIEDSQHIYHNVDL